MAEPPVANTSPLIVLAHGGWLDLLQAVGERVLVPRAVEREIRRQGLTELAARRIAATPWIQMVEPQSIPDSVRQHGLDPGEEAVLAWALAHPGTAAIIDDRRGRRVASVLGIPVVGTLGLIIEAKRRGTIPAARPVVDQLLRTTDWYLDARVREHALRGIGE